MRMRRRTAPARCRQPRTTTDTSRRSRRAAAPAHVLLSSICCTTPSTRLGCSTARATARSCTHGRAVLAARRPRYSDDRRRWARHCTQQTWTTQLARVCLSPVAAAAARRGCRLRWTARSCSTRRASCGRCVVPLHARDARRALPHGHPCSLSGRGKDRRRGDVGVAGHGDAQRAGAARRLQVAHAADGGASAARRVRDGVASFCAPSCSWGGAAPAW